LFVSVIIPVREISDYLFREGFPSFQKQINMDFEVIVVCDVVEVKHVHSLQKIYEWLKIVDHPGSPSEKRNFGVKNARGKIIAFIDDDVWTEKNWIYNVCSFFKSVVVRSQDEPLLSDFVALCGPGVLAKNSSFIEQVFDSVLTSKLGSGSFTYRFQKEEARLVDDYPLMNFVIKKSVFTKLKGLPNHWPGEDSKLCEELTKNKFAIRYSPDLVVYHHRKNSLTEFLLQHSRYGFKRGLFFAEGDKNSRKIVYLFPSLLLLYLLCLPFELYFFNSTILLAPFYLYFLLLLFFAGFLILRRRGMLLSVCAGVVMFLMHMIYAIYFIQGFFYGLLHRFRKIYR
jgi:cellulose synthase/poly-beta-1,6-N-acetylglucosamine synthase-like glycosyltransferase